MSLWMTTLVNVMNAFGRGILVYQDVFLVSRGPTHPLLNGLTRFALAAFTACRLIITSDPQRRDARR